MVDIISYVCAASPYICVGYNMSPCIRRYAKYLNAKAFSYQQMAYDFCKIKKG